MSSKDIMELDVVLYSDVGALNAPLYLLKKFNNQYLVKEPKLVVRGSLNAYLESENAIFFYKYDELGALDQKLFNNVRTTIHNVTCDTDFSKVKRK